jgi:hypothetical protein
VLNSSLAQLVYATYLGGSGGAGGYGIAADGSGNAYVTGGAGTGFPTTSGAFQTIYPAHGAGVMAFVAKINPTLLGSASLVYSTYLGGKGGARAFGIAVDGSGNAYVTGLAWDNFPTKNPLAGQSSMGKALLSAFVTTFNASGSSLLFSTYLGGTNLGDQTKGLGIALDASGNTYLTGSVGGTDFPVTSGAFQPTYAGGVDAFVAKISPVVSPPPSMPLDTSQQNPTQGRTADTLLAALAAPFRLRLLDDPAWVARPSAARGPDHPVRPWPAQVPALWAWLAATNESTSGRPLHPWTVQERVFAEFALPWLAAGDGNELPWHT